MKITTTPALPASLASLYGLAPAVGDTVVGATGGQGTWVHTGTGFVTWMTTPSSANLLATLTTKTGTGLNVFGTAPTISDPVITSSTAATGDTQVYVGGQYIPQSTGNSGTGSPIVVTLNAVGNTVQTPAIKIVSTTPATAGQPQWSGMFYVSAQGWNSVAVASQAVDWGFQLEPFLTAGVPTSSFRLYHRENGSAWTQMTSFDSSGILKVGASSTASFQNRKGFGAGVAAEGAAIANLNTAANASQRWSPYYSYEGQGYNPTAAAARVVMWRHYVVPVQQASNEPTAELWFDQQINGVGFTKMLALLSQGGMFVGNDTVTPGTPTAGYHLYAETGALKGKGTSATVTTIGVADPHCPTCGSDHGIEFDNATFDEYTWTCLRCLLGSLQSLGIKTSAFSRTERPA